MIKIDEREPEGYEWYKEQIAGHHPSVIKGNQKQIGLLKKKNGKNVLKVVQDGMKGELEVQFYDTLFNQDVPKSLELLKSFVPEYFGLHDIKFTDKTFKFIELADIAEGYKFPCQMDVKIGIKTFDPHASLKKQENERYRLNLIDNIDKNNVSLIAKDRVWGRSFDEKNVLFAFKEFFIHNSSHLNSHLLENFLKQLKTLESWFSVQTSYHFYASSLLFVYEGNAKVKEELKPTIKMIDFSHTYSGNGQLDKNYIPGLQNLIEIFEKCLNLM
ncbi:Inositol polyphosphate multikinase [Strongyloides ratti]|uniref:Kinase n=1 Tax=Strongyloides ratti TaxID=34506 RepID=A0A090KU87_STRRB|nr:Inositol polyphosphate multikinase [Strongyloides ratti]CEF61070.1 Inositol polyphosphate multikinase [Strongyloides ratti]